MKMAGLYIHIPFCRSRCIYCGFYSTTGLELRQRYVEAVCKEICMVCKDTPIRTIYLGGGTPSQLTIPQLQQILNAAYIYNKVETDAEITNESLSTLFKNMLSRVIPNFFNRASGAGSWPRKFLYSTDSSSDEPFSRIFRRNDDATSRLKMPFSLKSEKASASSTSAHL